MNKVGLTKSVATRIGATQKDAAVYVDAVIGSIKDGMIEDGKISNAQAKQVVDEMMHGEDPEAVAEKKGLKQMSDTGAIEAMVKEALDENPQAIEDFKNGKGKALGFLMGQVMKKSKGQANGGIVNKLIKEELQKRIGE